MTGASAPFPGGRNLLMETAGNIIIEIVPRFRLSGQKAPNISVVVSRAPQLSSCFGISLVVRGGRGSCDLR